MEKDNKIFNVPFGGQATPGTKSALNKDVKPVEITPDLVKGLMGYPFGGTSFKIKK